MREREIEISSASAVEHLLENSPERLLWIRLFGDPKNPSERAREIFSKAQTKKIRVDWGTKRGENWIAAAVSAFRYAQLAEWCESVKDRPRGFVVALDHIQDPQNFGAICRTAEGLGALGVIIPKDRSALVTEGVYSASVGAVETIPIVQVANLGEALRRLKKERFWIVGASLSETAVPLEKLQRFEKTVLVLGTELHGLSHGIEGTCDLLTYISMKGRVQSLNVSASAAILMHEIGRI